MFQEVQTKVCFPLTDFLAVVGLSLNMQAMLSVFGFFSVRIRQKLEIHTESSVYTKMTRETCDEYLFRRSCVSGQNFKSWIQLALVIGQSFCSFEYE